MNENNHIDILIGKSVSGNATPEEIKELEQWKLSAEENQLLFKKSKKAWEKSDKYISETTLQKDKSKLESEYNRSLSDRVRKMSRQSFIYKIAAILAFPVALAIGWYLFGESEKPVQLAEQLYEISSPKGHVSKVKLPDGTEVWINTNSSIGYDASSFNTNNREIQLKGEAYFEVTSSVEKPFTVVTPHANVKVTGTAFNVKAYPASLLFETVLAEGKIELQLKSGTTESIHVEPNQRVIFNSINKKFDVQQVESEMFTAWRNGEIIFKDATLNDLIKELERIYDIQFHLKPATLGELRFRGMFSYNNNLIEALEKIKKSSQVDYYIENKEVWLKKSN
ncbi:MAG: FecR domain-containing protein [Bacteroidales bacterium]|nr:FecR domain-containing protein [Bacteroidales bacterium]